MRDLPSPVWEGVLVFPCSCGREREVARFIVGSGALIALSVLSLLDLVEGGCWR